MELMMAMPPAAAAPDRNEVGMVQNTGRNPNTPQADSDSATIEFADDWSETVTGELVAGASLEVAYDLDRLEDCRGSTNGSEVWGVTGYASFDGAAPVTFELSRLDGGAVVPVARGRIRVPG